MLSSTVGNGADGSFGTDITRGSPFMIETEKARFVQVRTQLLEDEAVDKMPPLEDRGAIQRLLRDSFCTPRGLGHRAHSRFLRSRIRVSDVTISGAQLLRHLGYARTHKGFGRFLGRYYPKLVADRLLTAHGLSGAPYVMSFPARRAYQLRSIGRAGEDELIPDRSAYADQSWFAEIERPSGLLTEIAERDERLPWEMSQPSPGEEHDSKRLHDLLERLIDRELSPREVEVVCRYFGLRDHEELNYKEIGERLGVSGTRVWQMAVDALRKLRLSLYERDQRERVHADGRDYRGHRGWDRQAELERPYRQRCDGPYIYRDHWSVGYEVPTEGCVGLAEVSQLADYGITMQRSAVAPEHRWLVWQSYPFLSSSHFFLEFCAAWLEKGRVYIRVITGWERRWNRRFPMIRTFSISVD